MAAVQALQFGPASFTMKSLKESDRYRKYRSRPRAEACTVTVECAKCKQFQTVNDVPHCPLVGGPRILTRGLELQTYCSQCNRHKLPVGQVEFYAVMRSSHESIAAAVTVHKP